MDFNTKIFDLINGLAGKNIFIDNIMIIISKYLPYLFVVSMVLVYVIGILKESKKMRGIAIDTFIVGLISFGLSSLIGIFYFQERPFVVQDKVNLLYKHKPSASFPSNHVIGSMSITTGMFKYKNSLGKFYLLLTILMGISRIYVGHHYPSDVLAGIIVPIIVNCVYSRGFKKKVRRICFKIEKYIPILNKLV